ncbi:hypothetical protein KDA_75300 [Dictyobacter alpinus]|uniref:Uncharacterized protein n=1 Tax=Dictyobacter alpinus TaxID=2014873 RepID=A0A402BL45_9CHLR|nr:hypothetical protein [Dictyobacter alpinus]GCE32046.1 hypothetical protein KDA_75300 [Dictyobacter alpinus]
MSVLQQELPPLLKEEVLPLLTSDQITDQHMDVLRWLVWLSLLTREELGRVLKRDTQTLWNHLDFLTKCGLIDYVILNETGWPRRHHRYYITDLGLHVLAARHAPALSARKIAMSYPVTQADLLERLARPRVHLLLCELVTRLITECPAGYHLSSYQQPYKQAYRDVTGKNHTMTFDAAFLLQTPGGAQHAFYIHIDQPEHMFSQKEAKVFIKKLFALRQWMRLQGEVMPHLLLLSGVERFSFWSEHLERITLNQGISLLSGSITDTGQMRKGAYAPIWIPFQKLPEHDGRVKESDLLDLLSLLDRPISSRIAEQFSQYFTFQHLLLRKEANALSPNRRTLKRYVESSLQEASTALTALLTPRVLSPEERKQRPAHAEMSREILDILYGAKEERLAMSTQLTLALSNQQKDILAHLTRHPYLSQPDLLTLLHPESQNERLLARQMTPLIHMGFVRVYSWDNAPSWRVHERYYASESVLRFFAVRHGLSPAYYLHPIFPKDEKRHPVSPLSRKVVWLQHGAGLLKQQMPHTAGVYTCVRAILAASYQGAPYRINYWKSAQESVRWHQDPFHTEEDEPVSFIRPDAELLYTVNDVFIPRPLLIEYDRATTYSREHTRKMRCYADYQHLSRTMLPPMLMIVRNERAAQSVRAAIVSEKAFDVRVIMILEEQVVREGLLPVLDQLRCLSLPTEGDTVALSSPIRESG